jgi:hypothetical protein
MRHLFEHFIGKQRPKCGGSLGVARRADPSLPTRKTKKMFSTAVKALKSSETRFRNTTIEISPDRLVHEAAPSTVGLFESVLP